MPRMTRIGLAFVVALVLAAVAVSIAFAQGELLDGKLRTGDQVTIGADETVDGDLYVIAGTVTVDGTIDGDLTAFGGTVMLNGDVTGDVLASGGTVTIGGDVAGDVRTAGGQVTLTGSVGEDVVAAGGQATIQGGATVDGDLIISGGQVTVGGAVAGNLEASAGTYNRTGTVGGTEHVSRPDRKAAGPGEPDTFASKALDGVRHFIVLLLIGAAMLWLLPRVLGSSASALRQRPAASLGFGVVALIGWVVLVIVAIIVIVLLAILFGVIQLGALVAIDIIGGILGLFVVSFGFAIACAFIADLVVGFAFARLLNREADAGWWPGFGWLAIGVAIVVIVTSLPIIGGIAKLLVVLFGLGALFLAARGGWRVLAGSSAPEPPPPVPAG